MQQGARGEEGDDAEAAQGVRVVYSRYGLRRVLVSGRREIRCLFGAIWRGSTTRLAQRGV